MSSTAVDGSRQSRRSGDQLLPLVSYILVNWNTEAFLPDALASVDAQAYPFREIVLVNNGSPGPDGRGFRLDTGLPVQPHVYINNPRNLGFAAANNQGIAAAAGDIIILLNCDARLDPDFTRRALNVFQSNPRIGSVVAKQFADDDSGRLESTGHVIFSGRTASNRGRGEIDQGQYDAGGFVFGGNAAAIAYRREMLEEVAQRVIGLGSTGERLEVFDESFFAYFEDVDLDWRAQLAGWLAYYEPRCVAWHHSHGSGGRRRWRIRFLAEKNRYLMLVKNDTFAGQLAAFFPLLAYELLHAVNVLMQPSLWLAWLALLYHLPGALAARWLAGSQRRLRPAELQHWFRPYGLQPPPKAEASAAAGEDDESSGGAGSLPLASVIVLNWNGLNMTRNCLDSLLEQSYEPLEIIVVDNGSAADEAELLRMEYGIAPGESARRGLKSLRVLRLPRNNGFAGGVNWGLSLAHGEYLVLVNNDCVVDPDCIKRLVYAARSSGADAVSGRLVNVGDVELVAPAVQALRMELEEDPEDVIWDMPPRLREALEDSYCNHGVSLFGYRAASLYPPTGKQELGPGPDALKPTFYPSGGLCLLTRKGVEPILPELFPTLYFAYHEDNFLGYRLRAHGLRVIKEPRAAAVHIHNATSSSLGPVRLRFFQERNRLLRMLTWLPGSVLLRLFPLFLLHSLLGCIWTLLRQPREWPGMMLAHLWLGCHWGTILQHRRRYRAELRVPDRDILRELSGRMRGSGGVVNAFSVWWCRLMAIPCFESAQSDSPAGQTTLQSPHEQH